jgi:hypothetical protein
MYIHAYVCMYVHTYTHIHACMHAYRHKINTYTCSDLFDSTYTSLQTYIHFVHVHTYFATFDSIYITFGHSCFDNFCFQAEKEAQADEARILEEQTLSLERQLAAVKTELRLRQV